MSRKPNRDWFLTTEAAAMIGISKARLNVLIKLGLLPNTATPSGISLIYRGDIDTVRQARSLGLFQSGRPSDIKPSVTYKLMRQAIKEAETQSKES